MDIPQKCSNNKIDKQQITIKKSKRQYFIKKLLHSLGQQLPKAIEQPI